MTQKVVQYLSHELNADVKLEGIDVKLFKKIVLKGLYIEDQHSDTLLYAKEIIVDINKLNYSKHKLVFNSIELSHSDIDIKKYSTEDELNFQFIINAFSSSNTNSSSVKWTIKCEDIILKNISFTYHNMNALPVISGIDYNNIGISDLSGTISNIESSGDITSFNVKKLSLKEKSGFLINNLEANAEITPNRLAFDNVNIKTENSSVQSNLSFSFDNYKAFDDFNNNIIIKASIENALVSTQDLSYFTPSFNDINATFRLSGNVRGTISNLKIKDAFFLYGRNTYFNGNANLSGLPNFGETFIDIEVEDFRTNKNDIETFASVYNINNQNSFSVPSNIGLLGNITFKGKFNGFLNDLVAYGNFRTALGSLSSDINLKYDIENNKSEYSGHLSCVGFDIGRFLMQEQYIGKITFRTEIRGKGLSIESLEAVLTGNISSIYVNNYNYKNIELEGKLAKSLFNGSFSVKEENLELEFNGNIDFSKNVPVFDFTSEVKNAYLHKINLVNRDSSSVLNALLAFHFSGNKLDNLDGTLEVSNIIYIEKGDSAIIENLSLESSHMGLHRDINLNSDVIDASIKGEYEIANLYEALKEVLKRLLPKDNIYAQKVYLRSTKNQIFDFDIQIKNSEKITKIFFPSLHIGSNTLLSGNFNSVQEQFLANIVSPVIEYNYLKFTEANLRAVMQNQTLSTNIDCKQLIIRDSLAINKPIFEVNLNKENSSFDIQLANYESSLNKAYILGNLFLGEYPKIGIKFKPSSIILNNSLWAFNEDNFVSIDGSHIIADNLVIANNKQFIKINGRVSKNIAEQIEITFSDFDIDNLDPVFTAYNLNLDGIVNGKTFFAGVLSNRLQLNSNLFITEFGVNGDSLGNASITSRWDEQTQIFYLDANVVRGSVKNIEIKGEYDLSKANDNLNLDIIIQKVYLQMFSRYTRNFVKDLKGIVSADIKVNGSLKEPLVTGKLKLQKTSFIYTYLNTQYSFTDEILITENTISFKGIVLNDINGNTATATGIITHNYFKDFKFDIQFSPKNFQVLNTNFSQNDLYYGIAYATGSVLVNGDVDNLKLDINIKLDKGSRGVRGTKIYIPLSNTEEISQSDFITFIKKDTANSEIKIQDSYKVDLSGIQMELDLEATPDAVVQLIFDSKIGDVIECKGSGNIKMKINTSGDFSMYGNYVIENGDYLFTLQNIVNKEFQIEKGGMIRWNGDPYDAEVNLTAIYKAYASLYDLLPGLIDSSYRKRMNIECELYLTDKLLNPNVRFDISVPNLDDAVLTLMNRYINNDQEMNKQVFSLLVFNRFVTPAALSQASDGFNPGVGASTSELISHQLSNWASQISKDFDVGVNYRTGDEVSKDEWEVALSTQLFDDRISIDGSVGNSQLTGDLVGDFNVEVKVSKDGKFRVKAFNKSNNNQLINTSPYTQGAGIFYREEFNSIGELLERYKLKRERKKIQKNK